MLFAMSSAGKCLLVTYQCFCAVQLAWISYCCFFLLLILSVCNFKHRSSPIQIDLSVSFCQLEKCPLVQKSRYIWLYQQSS